MQYIKRDLARQEDYGSKILWDCNVETIRHVFRARFFAFDKSCFLRKTAYLNLRGCFQIMTKVLLLGISFFDGHGFVRADFYIGCHDWRNWQIEEDYTIILEISTFPDMD